MNPELGDDRDSVLRWHDAFVAHGIDVLTFRCDDMPIEFVWKSTFGVTRVTRFPFMSESDRPATVARTIAVSVIPAKGYRVPWIPTDIAKVYQSDVVTYSAVPRRDAADTLGHREWVLAGYERDLEMRDCEPKPIPWFYVQAAPRTLVISPSEFLTAYAGLAQYLVENPQRLAVTRANAEPANPWHAPVGATVIDTANWLRSPWRSGTIWS